MKRGWLLSILYGLVVTALMGMYAGFRSYANYSAEEIVNTVMRAEAAAIQQGNLLNSLTKLQSSIATSESLAGIAVYDLARDPGMDLPLILMGRPHTPSIFARAAFNSEIAEEVQNDKTIIFYFRPRFLFWSYLFFSLLTLTFATGIVWVVKKIENIRDQERVATYAKVAQQIIHDVKSPLTAIKLFSGVVAKRGMTTEVIEGGIQRIEEILSDLNSRANSRESFAVRGAIQSVVTEKTVQHAFHKINFFSSDGDFSVRGAPSDFKRVISNLLNNAIEASPEGSAVEVHLRENSEHINVTIKDRGRGIPPKTQSQLFRRGFSSGKPNGSGLGLFHAKSVISQMSGDISIQSKENFGTSVAITLPKVALFPAGNAGV